jgi:hypothetical protein
MLVGAGSAGRISLANPVASRPLAELTCFATITIDEEFLLSAKR